jgi:hypothetical protein
LSETVTVAIIAVAGTLGAGLLTFCGTVITQYFSRRGEQSRQHHELEIKRMDVAQSTHAKQRDERIKTYNTFYGKAYLLQLQLAFLEADLTDASEVKPSTDFEVKLSADVILQLVQDLYAGIAEMELIAPSSVAIHAEKMLTPMVEVVGQVNFGTPINKN